MIPIDINRTLEGMDADNGLSKYLGDRIRINELRDRLAIGPSKEALGQVLQAVEFTRQDTKRIRVFGLAALLFAFVAAGAVFFAIRANAARIESDRQRQEAERQKSLAEEQRRYAEEQEANAKKAAEAERVAKEEAVAASEKAQRSGYVSELWEKIYLYQAVSEKSLSAFSLPDPPKSLGDADMKDYDRRRMQKQRELELAFKPLRKLQTEIKALMSKNKTWVGRETYKGVTVFIHNTELYFWTLYTSGSEAAKIYDEKRKESINNLIQLRKRIAIK